MKKFLILILALITVLPALSFASPEGGRDSLCSITYLIFSDIISKATNHSPLDKNRHCAISCMLTLRYLSSVKKVSYSKN